MPTVLRIGPYRFFFVSLDRGEPAPIHVRRDEMVAKFWLEPLVLESTGSFSRHELTTIAKLIEQHQDDLLESWYEFFGH
jgi:hypothetical protein